MNDWMPQEPDWRTIIIEIGNRGKLSRAEIAELVGASVSNIDHYCSASAARNPSYTLGSRLLALHEYVMREER